MHFQTEPGNEKICHVPFNYFFLNPASVEFAEDLPAAGRCKAARAQTYYDTSSPCQHSRFGKIGAL